MPESAPAQQQQFYPNMMQGNAPIPGMPSGAEASAAGATSGAGGDGSGQAASKTFVSSLDTDIRSVI